MMNALAELFKQYQRRVEGALIRYLPDKSIIPTRLHEAMHYSVLNGGKRLRPVLVYLTGEALGASFSRQDAYDDAFALLDVPACAVEFIHAYSLIHDDLPAMDDDDLRRGMPTCHKAFDEATAILAGDALQTLAFYLLSHAKAPLNAENRLKWIETLALASGSRGMAGGQAIDMVSSGKTLTLAELENMHIHKTGALIRASVRMGAVACSATEKQLDALDSYAKCIGLAFQIQDDILDVEGTTDVLGKKQGADSAHQKVTYPALLGLNQSKQMAQDLITQAHSHLQEFDNLANPLRSLADYIITRKY